MQCQILRRQQRPPAEWKWLSVCETFVILHCALLLTSGFLVAVVEARGSKAGRSGVGGVCGTPAACWSAIIIVVILGIVFLGWGWRLLYKHEVRIMGELQQDLERIEDDDSLSADSDDDGSSQGSESTDEEKRDPNESEADRRRRRRVKQLKRKHRPRRRLSNFSYGQG